MFIVFIGEVHDHNAGLHHSWRGPSARRVLTLSMLESLSFIFLFILLPDRFGVVYPIASASCNDVVFLIGVDGVCPIHYLVPHVEERRVA